MFIGLDVGSVRRKGGFSWATSDEVVHGQDDPALLGKFIVEQLERGERVALAVECPLSVPIPEPTLAGWAHLGRARSGEGNRPWSAGAGAGALATGLAQLTWLCSFIEANAQRSFRTTTRLNTFQMGAEFFIAEAMVTATGKPESVGGRQDYADAVASAERLVEVVSSESTTTTPDVCCAPMRSLNLAAIAALHAGLDVDPAELRDEVVVAKAEPVRA